LDVAINETRQLHNSMQAWAGVVSIVVVALAFIAQVANAIGLQRLDAGLEDRLDAAKAAEESYRNHRRDMMVNVIHALMVTLGDSADGKGASKELSDEQHTLTPRQELSGLIQALIATERADLVLDPDGSQGSDSLPISTSQDVCLEESQQNCPQFAESVAKDSADNDVGTKKTLQCTSARHVHFFTLFVDMIGILAIGIPCALTGFQLVNANNANDLESVLLHTRRIQSINLSLTTTAQLCALTGDSRRADEYMGFVESRDVEINRLAKLEPSLVSDFVTTARAANNALTVLEDQALAFCTASPRLLANATALLFGEEYGTNKADLNTALSSLRKQVDQKQTEHNNDRKSFVLTSRVLMIVCALLVVGSDTARVLLSLWHGVESQKSAGGRAQLFDPRHVLKCKDFGRVQKSETCHDHTTMHEQI
jgi:hypothetical protein